MQLINNSKEIVLRAPNYSHIFYHMLHLVSLKNQIPSPICWCIVQAERDINISSVVTTRGKWKAYLKKLNYRHGDTINKNKYYTLSCAWFMIIVSSPRKWLFISK